MNTNYFRTRKEKNKQTRKQEKQQRKGVRGNKLMYWGMQLTTSHKTVGKMT